MCFSICFLSTGGRISTGLLEDNDRVRSSCPWVSTRYLFTEPRTSPGFTASRATPGQHVGINGNVLLAHLSTTFSGEKSTCSWYLNSVSSAARLLPPQFPPPPNRPLHGHSPSPTRLITPLLHPKSPSSPPSYCGANICHDKSNSGEKLRRGAASRSRRYRESGKG